jgi:UPF0755 protein
MADSPRIMSRPPSLADTPLISEPTPGSALRRRSLASEPSGTSNHTASNHTASSRLSAQQSAASLRTSRIVSATASQRPFPTSARSMSAEPPILAEPIAPIGAPPRPAGRSAATSTSSGMNGRATAAVESTESYAPQSGRYSDGAAAGADAKRSPRSPRAALEPEHIMTMPTRRSKRARHPFVIIGNAIFTLLILVAVVGGVGFAVGKHRFEAPGPLEQEKVVNVPARLGILDIADLLRREGVMDEHPAIFLGGVIALKARSELKSGEYVFPKRASVHDVISTMVDGKVVQHSLTLPEGLTSEQIVARLMDNEVLTGEIAAKDIPKEGSLLPNTYNFNRGDTREHVLQRMQQAQTRFVKEVWDRRSADLPLKTPEQLVILASIIEKETGKPDERTRIASVFVNRLKQKMRLQSDPTVIYGIVGGKGTLGRPLSKKDLEQPNSYNTYVIDALPVTPIANPGRASIEAAANPARTRELYFVADGTGGHAFSETYDQHRRSVTRLRTLEQNDRNASIAPPPESEDAAAPARAAPAAARPPQQKRSTNAKN